MVTVSMDKELNYADLVFTSKEAKRDTQFEESSFSHRLFEMIKNKEGKADIKLFMEDIKHTGVRLLTDPRLVGVVDRLKQYRSRPNQSLETLSLNFEQFEHVLNANLTLLTKVFTNDLVMPEFQAFCSYVTKLYNELAHNFDGNPAGYIPQLARVPKEKWGISICTVDGQRFSIGDVNEKFTIQSTSKPITYALTLSELGTETVHKYQGREPSGRMFNEIILDHNNQPHNPMVNSGAMMSASILLHLVKPDLNLAQKYDYVFDFFKRMAGGEYMGFNNSIFLSERDSADRNNALAYFMRENKCFPPASPSSGTGPNAINIPNILDFYFQTCSLEMTCESESVIAATLANGGVCPITDQRVMTPAAVKNVLSLMLSCGLYNYSGDFAFKVGLPGKSGVSGALVLVVPNVMGITFWSPPLDDMGNTVRGVQFCEAFVKQYNFHKVSGELSDGSSPLIDPLKNKYELASQLIIHLLKAASAGDETALKCAFQQGVDMNLGDCDGRTALHLAAAEGHVRCVRFLLEHCKVNHDCKDRWGHTPLTDAILFKHTKVVSLIRRHKRSLQENSDVSSQWKPKSFTGDALWRQLVNRNLWESEKENTASTDKFDPASLATVPESPDKAEEDEEALEKLRHLLKDKLTQRRPFPTSSVEEQHAAASVIQNRFRQIRKGLLEQNRQSKNKVEDNNDPLKNTSNTSEMVESGKIGKMSQNSTLPLMKMLNGDNKPTVPPKSLAVTAKWASKNNNDIKNNDNKNKTNDIDSKKKSNDADKVVVDPSLSETDSAFGGSPKSSLPDVSQRNK